MQRIKATFHPERYHGFNKKRRFFEGWYYKIVNKAEDRAFAFIPGIAMDTEGNQQAFIQVLDGKNLTADYFKFEASEFKMSKDEFDLQLADNHFNAQKISLDLDKLKGEVRFKNHVPWPSSAVSPNIMGPFSFVPFMQCYHGILSMDHDLEGVLEINGESIDFTAGKGYNEKDWGYSFPKAYVWMQSNHFSTPGISLKASVAKIPWIGNSFTGFIAGLWLKDELIQFTTYNFTKLRQASLDPEKVALTFENRKYKLEIMATQSATTALAAPIQGFMDGRVEESMNATMGVKLTEKRSNRLIFEDQGRNAGLEVAGEFKSLEV